MDNTGFSFDEPQDMGQPQEQFEEQPMQEAPLEQAPEPVEAPQDPYEERFRSMEDYLARVSQYLESVQQPQQAPAPAPQPVVQRQRPNFGDNTVAATLWDELQALRSEIREPWERVERERKEKEATDQAFAQLQDEASRYIAQRKQEGDPEVDQTSLIRTLSAMGMIRDKRIPVTTALEYAYNAIAFKTAKQRAGTQALIDARKREARLPVFRSQNAAQVGGPRPTMNRQPMPGTSPRPLSRAEQLQAEMKKLEAQLSQVHPDDLAESFGGFGR
jgi:hypothetical protein